MAKVTHDARVSRAIHRVYVKKWSFLAVFFVVFFLSFSMLASVGLVPENGKAKEEERVPRVIAPVTAVTEPELPLAIEIPALDLEATIANPATTDVAALDRELLKGTVRYPTSAKLGEEGNVVLFGHSSYLPVVHNQAYKAFNEIQKLKQGDRIIVHGGDRTYVYAVSGVFSADATSDAIPLTVEGNRLTLVTCDSFTSKSNRFVVTANLVESYPIAN